MTKYAAMLLLTAGLICASDYNNLIPPSGVVVKKHSAVRTTFRPMDSTQPTFDLAGLDYGSQPLVRINRGTTNFHTLYDVTHLSYHGNYVAATGLATNQIAWFEITFPPFRDARTNDQHKMAYRLAVNGSWGDVIRTWIKDDTDTSWFPLHTLRGDGYRWQGPDPLTWYDCTVSGIGTVTNLTLHVEYYSGGQTPYILETYNRGCIDRLSYENDPPDNPIQLRMETDWLTCGQFEAGDFISNDCDCLRVTWPMNTNTIVNNAGTYRLNTSTNLNGPWWPYSMSPTNVTLDGLRYVAFPRPADAAYKGTMFLKMSR